MSQVWYETNKGPWEVSIPEQLYQPMRRSGTHSITIPLWANISDHLIHKRWANEYLATADHGLGSRSIKAALY
jgi:hypothetical protein